jgi:hypothetical protein
LRGSASRVACAPGADGTRLHTARVTESVFAPR